MLVLEKLRCLCLRLKLFERALPQPWYICTCTLYTCINNYGGFVLRAVLMYIEEIHVNVLINVCHIHCIVNVHIKTATLHCT